ncbi:hypothetical protein F2P81_017544 [Scophthalmus maximus]|uniref:Uncharacterized protein n=1 Tax=Scophthalmus maximus TaxID=52904 RepID=A0A6A4S955_SCOMX|nr:hypothetical protein F2P81_017544 [Scophthalmus maximus]
MLLKNCDGPDESPLGGVIRCRHDNTLMAMTKQRNRRNKLFNVFPQNNNFYFHAKAEQNNKTLLMTIVKSFFELIRHRSRHLPAGTDIIIT